MRNALVFLLVMCASARVLAQDGAATALEEARRVERDEQVVGEIAAAVEALDHFDREEAGGR